MENSADQWELKDLINELMLGKELARQLQIHLNAPSSSQETRELFVQKILNSYDKALYLLKETTQTAGVTVGMPESPPALSGSPCSEDSDREFKDHQEHPTETTPSKRNAMPRWTKHVQICPGTGLEGPLDDGYSWRKYGQKDILGARYPRGYYRCTHRHAQGCLATKQVQRSDDDSTIFEITYRGRHTCSQGTGSEPKPPSPLPEKQEKNSVGSHQQVLAQPQQYQPEILLSFQTGLTVMTENLDSHNQPFSSLNFPSSSTSTKAENYGFFPSAIDNNFPGNSSPTFMSPASASNFFSVSPSPLNNFAGNLSSHASESELTDLISAATSSTNSTTVGLDTPFGQMEFDSNFTFSNPGFFS